jgi:hypothetical protein
MRFEDLSPADQALVNTDFGTMDKVAEEMVKEASECYERGFEKTALEIADGLDKAASEEKEDKEEEGKHDEESEKKAEQLASFYERGVFDGLAKLGAARHGDEMHYFWPFVEEKVAAEGAQAALVKLGKVMEFLANAGKSMSPKAVFSHARKAAVGERTVGAKAAGKAAEKKILARAGDSGNLNDAQGKLLERARKLQKTTHLGKGERAAEAGKALGKGAVYAGAAGGAAAAAHHAAKKD